MEVIAVKERSAGNETVGHMWVETATFSKEDPISKILEWSEDKGTGRLIITLNESDKSNKKSW